MSQTTTKRKINIRNAAITSIKNLVEEFEQLKVSPDDLNNRRIVAIRDTIIEKNIDIGKLNDEILNLIEETEIESEYKNSTDFSVYVRQNLFSINKFVSDKEETTTTVSSASARLIRLPKLNLKPFDGQPENWYEFWDTFTHAVHENDSISDVQKMTYLKSLVTGTAAQTITGFKISSTNYAQALQLLKERYENKHLQISLHMNNLLEVSPITNINKVEELRELYNTVETQIRSLGNLGIDDSMYGPFLIPVLQRKVPDELNIIFSRQFHSRDSWDIKELLEQFKIELMAREKSVTQCSAETPYTASSLLSGANERKTPLICIFCGQSHKPQHCQSITDVKARKDILQKKGKCFRCLKTGHLSSRCTSRISCFTCKRSHHQAVCEGERQPRDDNKNPSSSTLYASSNSSASVLLQTARANVAAESDGKTKEARILFDSGSQLSYVSEELRHQLKLKTIERKEMKIKAFGTITSKEILDKVKLRVKTKDGKFITIECFVKNICHPLTSQNTTLTAHHYEHLKTLDLADSNHGNSSIDILIGADFYWSFLTNEIIRGSSDRSPVAIKSKLGYILSGPSDISINKNQSSVMISHVLKCEVEHVDSNTILNEHLDRFWTLETFDRLDSESETETENDIHSEFRKNLKFDWEEGRYCTDLPFKEDHDLLPDNYSRSLKRLSGLNNRFTKDPELFKNYNEIVKEQEKLGVIEEVPESEFRPVGHVHYLPHRPVVRNDRETTKVRMVFDASAKSNGTSLNDCLHVGPSLTESLYGVLLRFRLYKYVFIADIEKAFHQILINPEHRDFVRFLWYDTSQDISQLDSIPVKCYRFCRILFGLSSSPFLLSGTLIEHFQQLPDKKFVEKVLKSLHVDDLISGDDTEADTLNLFQESKEHLSIANFNLRKFHSNSDTLNHKVHGNKHSCGSKSKVLGLSWDSSQDKLFFEFDHLHQLAKVHPTKRELLAFMASIFDPLGLLNPFVVKLKNLFQNVCFNRVTWDDLIDEISLRSWSVIRAEFLSSAVLSFDRWVSCTKISRVEIHGFCDASKHAYGGCVYVKAISEDNSVSCSLISAKSRVAPAKSTTIPKLELMGANLLSNLVERVHHEVSSFVEVDDCFCWTDSMVVLHWICDTHKSHQAFVKKRVNSIRAVCPPHRWFHVDTSHNPADILSRGASISQLIDDRQWRHGPQFLSSLQDYSEFNLQNKLATSTTLLITEGEEEDANQCEVTTQINVFDLVNVERFNDVNKLYRIISYVRRFITNVKRRIEDHQLTTSILSAKEIAESRDLCITSSQQAVDSEKNFKQLKRDLGLYHDEKGVLRCRGRLNNSDLTFNSKFPIFLPKSKFAELIVMDVHRKVKHNGLKETLNELRTKFWITKARIFIKRIIRTCHICIFIESRPYGYPAAPDLPTSRVSISPPFTHVGIDYAGPVYVKSIYSPNSQTYKAWIVLYTCHATRNICLDLVPSYDAPSCIRTLRRFFSRRGVPTSIKSDNGSNFTAEETQNYCSRIGVQWTFNPPASPWWGGLFERLIRSTKRCIKKVLLKSKVTFEEMLTVLQEIETVINNRPLTFTYEEPAEEVLTPSHLVYGRRINLHSNDLELPDEENLPSRLKYLKGIQKNFWLRWKSEYLTELREHHHAKSTEKVLCNVGDLVLIQDDPKIPRLLLRMGVVEKIHPSRDNKIRVATVRYISQNKVIRLTRPVNKLIPVEGNDSNNKKREEITFVNDNDIPEKIISNI